MAKARNGFTLLEVMVALAIAIPALLLLYREGALAINVTGSSLAYQQAIARAQSHLAALTNDTLVASDREGDDGGTYRWHTRIVPLTTHFAQRATGRSGPYAGGVTLFDVTVQISWPGARGPQAVSLVTQRIGPATVDTP